MRDSANQSAKASGPGSLRSQRARNEHDIAVPDLNDEPSFMSGTVWPSSVRSFRRPCLSVPRINWPTELPIDERRERSPGCKVYIFNFDFKLTLPSGEHLKFSVSVRVDAACRRHQIRCSYENRTLSALVRLPISGTDTQAASAATAIRP